MLNLSKKFIFYKMLICNELYYLYTKTFILIIPIYINKSLKKKTTHHPHPDNFCFINSIC